MLVMGRTQGKGCYCFVNGLLETQLRRLEHIIPTWWWIMRPGWSISAVGFFPAWRRRFWSADRSRRGVQAAGRIAELIREEPGSWVTVGLIVNRAPGGVLNEGTREEIENQGLTLLGRSPG